MRKYEIMLAIRGTFIESEARSVYNSFIKHLKSEKAEIVHEESWGKMNIAYKIKHETEAYYYVVQFMYNSQKIKELELYLELDGGIIRSLVTKVENDEKPFTKEMYDTGMKNYIEDRKERQKKSMPKTRATTAKQLEEKMEKDDKDNKEVSPIEVKPVVKVVKEPTQEVSEDKINEVLEKELSL